MTKRGKATGTDRNDMTLALNQELTYIFSTLQLAGTTPVASVSAAEQRGTHIKPKLSPQHQETESTTE